MMLNFRNRNLDRAAVFFSLAVLASIFAMSSASAQQAGAAVSKQLTRSQQVERLIAEDAKYGSDTWRAQWLKESPRHNEMARIPGEKNRTLQAFVVYPATKDKVPVVMIVPEDQGLNDWARKMADEIAMMGYIAVVPDLLSGLGPNGGGRESFSDLKTIWMAHDQLTEAEMTAELNGWADYSNKLAQSNGKIAVMGFGWGAGRAFWFATQRKDLSATFIFYDVAPPAQALAGLTAPVYGFYAEKDTRVIKSLDATKAVMAAAGKKYEAVTYPGAEHMFVRLGEMPGNDNPANVTARYLSLVRLQELLKGM